MTLTNEHTMNQTQMIRQHLDNGGSITALEALRDFGCYRLASRISDLRAEGYPIAKTMEESRSRITGKVIHFARYTKKEEEK